MPRFSLKVLLAARMSHNTKETGRDREAETQQLSTVKINVFLHLTVNSPTPGHQRNRPPPPLPSRIHTRSPLLSPTTTTHHPSAAASCRTVSVGSKMDVRTAHRSHIADSGGRSNADPGCPEGSRAPSYLRRDDTEFQGRCRGAAVPAGVSRRDSAGIAAVPCAGAR